MQNNQYASAEFTHPLPNPKSRAPCVFLKILRNMKAVVGSAINAASRGVQTKKRCSVYFHWPFCAKRCSYCNFNKYVPGKRGQAGIL